MIKLTTSGIEFRCSLAALSGYLLLFSLLCSLGFWQLNRGKQKTILLAQQQQASNAEALDITRQVGIDSEVLRYRPVLVSGHYDAPHQILIDNQTLNGKPGYLVLTPFLPDSGQPGILVNRGWVPLGASREVLPDIGISLVAQQVRGRINRFPEPGLKLKGAEIPGETWPVRVQVIDSQLLADKLGYALADYQIELDSAQPDGYQRQWKIAVAIPPEKHRAYAVQWFGLALTLTALFIWISSRKIHRG
ncbi:SURF1 family protein [Methylomonas fluvii]|uniref:SURF1-like protein n=1 Tax=Methylomonas fluvii TaxID=1854564 RepID=A0ABR9DJL2_9GAMM|nr:SURF1 family protein [Methylomonas fluvii]MBD9363215.1 SURF1 family protein [Methylomonas fluvii]CAD6876470.1 Cytochrome oxidase biogenesis protein Surf1, facilitates heme A insertion [Methylomonas fluvii]